jgi:hypothetical protein
LTADTERTGADEAAKPMSAGPTVAAFMAGATAFMWTEAIVRYLVTRVSLLNWYLIFPERVGDVVAIWLIAVIAGLVVFAVARMLFRGRQRVGSLRMWTALLVISLFLRYI